MADNVTIDNGDLTDYTPATDEVAGVHFQKVKLIDATADSTAPIGVSANPLITNIPGRLVDEDHDYIGLGYTGDNLTTVTYKSGGAGGTTVATLTLAYTGARLDSITKS